MKLPAKKQVEFLCFCLFGEMGQGCCCAMRKVSGTANPSQVLPGQAPKTPLEEMPHLPHHTQREKVKIFRAIPTCGRTGATGGQQEQFFISPLPWASPLATHRILKSDKLLCLTALCLWAFFCYAKGKSQPWFMWGCSHCFTLRGFLLYFRLGVGVLCTRGAQRWWSSKEHKGFTLLCHSATAELGHLASAEI